MPGSKDEASESATQGQSAGDEKAKAKVDRTIETVRGKVSDTAPRLSASCEKKVEGEPAEEAPEKVEKRPVVTAEATVNGQVFRDVNQTARVDANSEKPTLIAARVARKEAEKKKSLPNSNMGTAHAEVGAIQQAFEAGVTKDAAMTMEVSGKAVCGFCRGDVAAMAEKAGLKSLKIEEKETGKILYWKPGMRSLKEELK